MSAPTPWQLIPPNRKPPLPQAPLEWYVRLGFCALSLLILFMLHHLHPSFEDAAEDISTSAMAGFFSTQRLIPLYRVREKRIWRWAAWTSVSVYSLIFCVSLVNAHSIPVSWYFKPLQLTIVLTAVDAAALRPRESNSAKSVT